MILDYENISKRIKAVRKSRKMTQDFLAEQTNLSVMHISNLENNHCKMSLDSLAAISEVLNVSTDYILFGHSQLYINDVVSLVSDTFSDCTENEQDFLLETMTFTKQNLRKHAK